MDITQCSVLARLSAEMRESKIIQKKTRSSELSSSACIKSITRLAFFLSPQFPFMMNFLLNSPYSLFFISSLSLFFLLEFSKGKISTYHTVRLSCWPHLLLHPISVLLNLSVLWVFLYCHFGQVAVLHLGPMHYC